LALSEKQKKFVESYLVNNDAKKSAILAGYPDNKNTTALAWRLMKSPKILAELESCRTKIRGVMTKEKYIDKALESFELLDITEPNAPRFYDIAGKALGYTSNKEPNTVINNNTLNINVDSMTPAQLWEHTRKLLGNE
jgi:hypothetical protein